MKYEYDIAISYDHGILKKAKDIYDFLSVDGFKVFFEPENQEEILSEKGRQVLYDTYKNKSFEKVLLITEDYLHNEWTCLEMRVSLESAKKDPKRLIVVSYIEKEKLPEEIQEVFFIDGTKKDEIEIVSLIKERLEKIKKNSRKKSKNHAKKKNNSKDSMDYPFNVSVKNHRGIVTGDHAKISHIKF